MTKILETSLKHNIRIKKKSKCQSIKAKEYVLKCTDQWSIVQKKKSCKNEEDIEMCVCESVKGNNLN
jgi:hypothetical protein